MINMEYPMTLIIHPDYDDPYYTGSHNLQWDYDNFKGEFNVWNLNDCPEDAIIDRDLFDAYDFIHAVEFGMNLARKGYTKIKLTEIRENEDEDEDDFI